MPAIGALDRLLLEPGNEAFLKIRNAIVVKLVKEADFKCAPLHREGVTFVDMFVTATLRNGGLTVSRILSVDVTRGAPLSGTAKDCLATLITEPVTIKPPPPSPGSSARVVAAYTGKWVGFPDFEGDVVVRVAFSDRGSCDLGASTDSPRMR
jgi:hypothetical protein